MQSKCKPINCPSCGSSKTKYLDIFRVWRCADCRHVFKGGLNG